MKPVTTRINIYEPKIENGFTMTELIVVVALLAVVASVAVPQYRIYMEKSRLNGAARTVMTDLMHARSLAASENAGIKVVFSGGGYIVARPEKDDHETIMTTRRLDNEYPGVTITSNRDFLFRPDGTVHAAGTVSLHNRRGSRKIAVSMAGRVRIQ